MKPLFYILDENHQAVPCDDPIEAALFWEKNKKVRSGRLGVGDRRYWVSTVFLHIDHSGDLFETAIWDLVSDQCHIVARYSTYDLAAKGHKKIFRWLKQRKIIPPTD